MPFNPKDTVTLSDTIQVRHLEMPDRMFHAWMVFWNKDGFFFPALVKTQDLPTGEMRTKPLMMPERDDCFAWLKRVLEDNQAVMGD